MILKSIHFENIKINELEDEILNELKKIEMIDYLKKMKNKNIYRYLNNFSVENEKVEQIILKYYKEEEEDIIKEEDLKELKNETIASVLLKNKDIKMKEIGLMIIIESGIDYKSIIQFLFYYK